MRSRYLAVLAGAAALVATAALAGQSSAPGVEKAQMVPPPFGGPRLTLPGAQSCAPEYKKLLKVQAEAMRQLQRLSRGEGDKLCSTLESADLQGVDKLIDPKLLEKLLTPDQRDLLDALGIDLSKVNVAKLMQRLGIDPSQIDLRQIRQQCRQGQDGIERFAASELERVEKEIIRCDDRI
jgi:hypothetical protein